MVLPVNPPVEPMLAALTPTIPDGDRLLFEPKWDGYRCLVFRDGKDIFLQSRAGKPFNQAFPEMVTELLDVLPDRVVLDGELVVDVDGRLSFDALAERAQATADRAKAMAAETPARYMAFDMLALEEHDLMGVPGRDRRQALNTFVTSSDRGVVGAFTAAHRQELATRLAPLIVDGERNHPWLGPESQDGRRLPGAMKITRWRHEELPWVPLRQELVVEVRYEHTDGGPPARFRHNAQFVRWRPDREPRSCTYEQLEQPAGYHLDAVIRGEIPQ